MLNFSPDGVICIDANSTVLEWSRACETLFGWSRDEAVGANLAELIIPPDKRAAHVRGVARFMRTRVGTLIGLDALALEAVRKDGSRIAIRLSLSVCDADADDEDVKFVGFAQDDSAREALSTSLAEVRETTIAMRAFLSEVPAGVLVLDATDRCVFRNAEFDAFASDRSVTEIIEELGIRAMLRAVSPAHRVAVKTQYVFRTQRYYDVRVIHVPSNGHAFDMVFLRDNTVEVTATRRKPGDVSETASDAHRTRFLKDLGACLRRSLSEVMAAAEHDHGPVSSAARRMSEAVDMSERVARMESNPPLDEVSLHAFLADVYDTYTRRFAEKHTSFVLDTDLGLPDEARVPVGVPTVLRALLDHCLKISGLKRTVALEVKEIRGELVASVLDSAAGEAADVARPFVWTTVNPLYIPFRAAQLMGGSLRAAVEGPALRFTLTVPRDRRSTPSTSGHSSPLA